MRKNQKEKRKCRSNKTKEEVKTMLREKATAQQGEYEIVLLEELVAEYHLLRKIDRAVDFSFIHDLCSVSCESPKP